MGEQPIVSDNTPNEIEPEGLPLLEDAGELEEGFSRGWYEKKCSNCKAKTTVKIDETFEDWNAFHRNVLEVQNQTYWEHCDRCFLYASFELVGMSPDPKWLAKRREKAEAECARRRIVLGHPHENTKGE